MNTKPAKNKRILTASLLTALLISAMVPLQSAATDRSVTVVGVTSAKSDGSLNPAKRHAECAEEFDDGYWCETREYLEGGISLDADEKLPTAWIRPSIIDAYQPLGQEILYTDVSGLQVPASQLNCLQWSSKENQHAGLALQRPKDNKKQIVIVNFCAEKIPNLCCARQ